jgi:hypothetical protein
MSLWRRKNGYDSLAKFKEENRMLLGCGCLLALLAGMAPRLVLILAWIFGSRWEIVFDGWIVPVLGIIFLPYTTVMYLLVWSPGGISGFDWVWLGLGVVLDLMKWGLIGQNRKAVPGYPENAM